MKRESDLLRYLEGECTPAEAAAIQAWLAADPHRLELLEQLRTVWSHTGRMMRPWDSGRARERLQRARGLPATPSDTAAKRSLWPVRQAWTIAAGVLLVLGGSALYLTQRTPSLRTYETTRGQRMTLSLPDGSRVLLSAASQLRLAVPFAAGQRALELQGEAYFTVQHDARRPFVVRTPHGTAEDLGTEFSVRAYARDTVMQVVVASGAVVMRGWHPAKHAAARTVRAHERGVVGAAGDISIVSNVELDSYLAWTRDRLIFDQAPLGDVITELERWYDVDIDIADRALEAERVTISFDNQTADQALSELATVLNAQQARSDGRVQLIRAHAPQ